MINQRATTQKFTEQNWTESATKNDMDMNISSQKSLSCANIHSVSHFHLRAFITHFLLLLLLVFVCRCWTLPWPNCRVDGDGDDDAISCECALVLLRMSCNVTIMRFYRALNMYTMCVRPVGFVHFEWPQRAEKKKSSTFVRNAHARSYTFIVKRACDQSRLGGSSSCFCCFCDCYQFKLCDQTHFCFSITSDLHTAFPSLSSSPQPRFAPNTITIHYIASDAMHPFQIQHFN